MTRRGASYLLTVSGLAVLWLAVTAQTGGEADGAMKLLSGIIATLQLLLIGWSWQINGRLARVEENVKTGLGELSEMRRDTATVDKRIGDTRHLLRNEFNGISGELELELRQLSDRVTRLEPPLIKGGS